MMCCGQQRAQGRSQDLAKDGSPGKNKTVRLRRQRCPEGEDVILARCVTKGFVLSPSLDMRARVCVC